MVQKGRYLGMVYYPTKRELKLAKKHYKERGMNIKFIPTGNGWYKKYHLGSISKKKKSIKHLKHTRKVMKKRKDGVKQHYWVGRKKGKMKGWKKKGNRFINRLGKGKYDFTILDITKFSKNVMIYTYPNQYKVEIERHIGGKTRKTYKEFKTKSQALKFAREYMKKHPRG